MNLFGTMVKLWKKEGNYLKTIVSDNFYYVKYRGRIGGTIRTDVFLQENNVFQAYSYYAQDKDLDIVGYGENEDELKAIGLSKRELKTEWIAEYPNCLVLAKLN